MAACFVRIFPSAKSSGHRVVRRSIEEFLLAHIHIKTFIQIQLHGIYVKIYRILPQQSLLLHFLVLEDDCKLPIRHSEIFIQVRKLLAIGILVQDSPSESYEGDDYNQHQSHDYRYHFLFHSQS